jgi:hypothetical protein
MDINQVEALIRAQFEQVLQICNDHHDFQKFLGDGLVLVWEESDEVSLQTCLARTLDAAVTLHKKYWYCGPALSRRAGVPSLAASAQCSGAGQDRGHERLARPRPDLLPVPDLRRRHPEAMEHYRNPRGLSRHRPTL